MSDDFDQVDRETLDLDNRLRAAARSADDAASLARTRNVVAARLVSPASRVPGWWRTRLLAAVAVVVPVAAAAAIAVVVLGQPHSTAHVVIPAGSASPSPQQLLTPAPSPLPSPSPISLAGFQPFAMSAISESEYWVLGCTAASVTTVVHTTDGGAHFAALGPVPPDAKLCVDSPQQTVGSIRFADPTNGWIFGPKAYSTHDGGATWSAVANLPGFVQQLEPGAFGMVYANASTGGHGIPNEVSRTIAKSDQWTRVNIPGGISGIATIGVHGQSLWVMVNGSSAALWVSRDEGVTFTRYADPCSPDLNGFLAPVSNTVIWAFCGTGTAGHPLVSTDGGQTFIAHGGTSFPNNTVMAATSAAEAFLVDDTRQLLRTADGGSTFQPAMRGTSAAGIDWIGFTDASVGYAAGVTGPPQVHRLWRSVDGGFHWALVSFG